MYEHTLDTLLSTYFIPEAGVPPFPLVSIVGSQGNPSQTNAVVPIEGSDTEWSVPPPTEGLVATVHVHEASHENSVSQNPSVHEVTTTAFLPVPFAVPTPTCGLAGGLHCSLSLDGSAKSIKLHLRTHGYRYSQWQTVQCPWMGCSHTLQWVNIPRHIQSIHLGVRFPCSDCGKSYTRLEGLARHVASLKCSGATHAGAQKIEESIHV